MEGVLVMAGPGVRQAGYKGNKAGLTDLAPTALHLLGFPVPNNMDGNVLQDWLSEQREVQTVQGDYELLMPPSIEETMTPEQEQELVQRLKDLGYLE